MTKTASFYIGLAEQAKFYHLEGRATLALLYLREALNQAEKFGEAAILARYYTQLSLEVLESEGHFEDVIEYCDNALAHYRDYPPETAIASKDLAEIWQRRGVCELQLNRQDAAQDSFRQALECAPGLALPIAQTLSSWISQQFQISKHRLGQLLGKHNYYSIRPETLNRERAIRLPQLDAVAI